MSVSIVDGAAVLIIALVVYHGWRNGLIAQAFAVAGFAVGVVAVLLLAPYLAVVVADASGPVRTAVVVAAFASIVLIAQGLTGRVGGSLRRRLGDGLAGGLDAGGGAVFGLVRGLFIIWLLGGLLAIVPVPLLATQARQSILLRALNTRLPSPIVLAAELGQAIEAAGMPVLVDAPPPVGAPAGRPPQEEAARIAAPARDSTVRVEAIACGGFITGTGFAVDDHHIVTNAHVVAGADQLWVAFDGAFDRFTATVVLFDPELDAALLYVGDATLRPLRLADVAPAKGEPAAALGFTGGGGQRVIPALVSRRIESLGRDIYGEAVVAREVIELRVDLAPGDSGGPLLLDDGMVGGVLFSTSTDFALLGYALSPVDVARVIGPAMSSQTPVANGACVR